MPAILLIAVLVFSGCAPSTGQTVASPTMTPTPSLTLTAIPTATELPAPTQTLTATPASTDTLTPEPSPTTTLSPEIYPPALPMKNPVNGLSLDGCPNSLGLQKKPQLPPEDAVRVINVLASKDEEIRRQALDLAAGSKVLYRSDEAVSEERLKIQKASASDYSVLLRAACGAQTLDVSWEIIDCVDSCALPNRSIALEAHIFLIDRQGNWLVWASYP